MSERFESRFPHARISQTVEEQAGKEFGPEKLKRTDIASALNLKESDISDAEWREISEFAVNAGADLIRAAIAADIPDKPRMSDIRTLRKRIRNNDDSFLPHHDIFHAAATYRETQSQHAAARFIEVGPRERYTDPQAISQELYPLLFFANQRMFAPLPVLLYSPEGRERVANFFSSAEFPEGMVGSIRTLLLKDDEVHAENRRTQYEIFVEQLLIGNAQRNLPDLTAQEARSMQEGFKAIINHPPILYGSFAPRVFNKEWETNPRLFLDEFLACIRTEPKPIIG